MSVLGLIMSISQYLRSVMVRFPLVCVAWLSAEAGQLLALAEMQISGESKQSYHG